MIAAASVGAGAAVQRRHFRDRRCGASAPVDEQAGPPASSGACERDGPHRQVHASHAVD